MAKLVVVIVGPTCSGKTNLSLELAEIINGEIISADSRQIYKYLDIGSAKPNKNQLEKIKHWFVDYLYPDETYSAGRFEKEAEEIIENIFSRSKIPIVVGGSGLYIKALIDGIADPGDIDLEIRNNLKRELETLGRDHLYDKLKKLDPITAETMGSQNYKRVIRALEVLLSTGKSIREFHNSLPLKDKFNFIQFGLMLERHILYSNINTRVDAMIENGLIEEAKKILNMGYSKNLNSLNTIGYKEIIEYIDGGISLEKAIELIKRNTRRYAKRQITWFKADKRINWIDVQKKEALEEIFKSLREKNLI